MTFADLAVPEPLLNALARQSISQPTAIQSAAIPPLLAGGDVYVHAPTGTGKTLAYLLPLFTRIAPEDAAVQIVILAPTHELAIQIQRQCGDLAVNGKLPIRSILLVGGTPMDRQIEKLKKKPHVAIGTLGRIAELVAMGKLKTKGVRAIVIDEADRMWVPENVAELRKLLAAAPANRQVVLASATKPADGVTPYLAHVPNLVLVQAGAEPVNTDIAHGYLVCEERDKPDVLRKLVRALEPARAIVFVHRSETAEELAARLEHHQIPAADLHGAGDKFARKKAMDDIRSGHARVLIASDVAARGLDLPGVTLVVNLDVPTSSDGYLHRVGRTGRAGQAGTAITLATERELRLIRRYEAELGVTLQHLRLREGQLIAVPEEAHREHRPDPRHR